MLKSFPNRIWVQSFSLLNSLPQGRVFSSAHQFSNMAEIKYKLSYFDARSMGEPIRYMLALAGVDYEDKVVEMNEEWPKLKPSTPFGQMPMLEIGDFKVAQTVPICRYLGSKYGFMPVDDMSRLIADAVADTVIDIRAPELLMFPAFINNEKEKLAELAKNFETEQFGRLVGNLERFLPNTLFVAGNRLTWVDVFMVAVIDMLMDGGKYFGYCVSLDSFPKIAAIRSRVRSHPRIAEWIQKRPERAFDL